MDGIHDLGGRQGFGAIDYRSHTDEKWEMLARALSVIGVKAGIFNIDEYRHAIERMYPRHYMAASYYERMLTAVATLCVEKGAITPEELAAQVEGAFPLSRPIGVGRAARPLQTYDVGETVRIRNEFVSGHVRMPAYIRGKSGVVVSESPPYPFPDEAAHGMEASYEPTYDIRFRSADIWPQCSDEAFVHVGVFQSYIEKIAQ